MTGGRDRSRAPRRGGDLTRVFSIRIHRTPSMSVRCPCGRTAGSWSAARSSSTPRGRVSPEHRALAGHIFVTWGHGDAADKTVALPVVDDLLDEVRGTRVSRHPLTAGRLPARARRPTHYHRQRVPPAITSAPRPRDHEGCLLQPNVTATGSPAPAFSVTAGTLAAASRCPRRQLSGFTSVRGNYNGITVTAETASRRPPRRPSTSG